MSGLSEQERLLLARAVYVHTGYTPPWNENDLSSILNPVEKAVDVILAARELGDGPDA